MNDSNNDEDYAKTLIKHIKKVVVPRFEMGTEFGRGEILIYPLEDYNFISRNPSLSFYVRKEKIRGLINQAFKEFKEVEKN